MGEIIGAILGMALIGAGLAWCIRKVRPSTDYRISVAVSMLVIAFGAGFSNNLDGTRPYWLTVCIYLVASIPGYFLVVWLSQRQVPAVNRRAEPPFAASSASADFDEAPPSAAPARSPTGIAWGRGFFRIWALLSLLWVIVVALLAWNSVFYPYVPTKALATPTGAAVPDIFDTYGSPYNGLSEAVTAGKLAQIEIRPGYIMFYPLTLDDATRQARVQQAMLVVDNYIATETVNRRSAGIPYLIAGLFVPPLVVLILGWLVGWAISGFRRAIP